MNARPKTTPARRTLAYAAVAWGFGLLVLPAAAYVAGARQPDLEARTKTPFPAINRSSLPNPKTFARLDAAILERLPLREPALELRGEIGVRVFRDSPNPDVLLGNDGWLLYDRTFDTCRDGTRPPSDSAAAAEIVARTLVASGRNTTVILTGSKEVTVPGRAPGVPKDVVECQKALETGVKARLAATPGGLNLTEVFARSRDAEGSVFRRDDTHWNGVGQLDYARAILDRIQPGLSADAGVRQIDEPVESLGDLARLIGLRRKERYRPVYAARAPQAPAPKRVVLIGDSQTERTFLTPHAGHRPLIEATLPGATWCQWERFGSGECDDALRASKTVVVQRVGRALPDFDRQCWRIVSLTGDELRGPAASWSRQDGGALVAGGRLPVDGQSTARIEAPSGDVAQEPRLLRIPVRRLGPGTPDQPASVQMVQQPTGLETPCATPAAYEAGGALILPVAAGRPLSQLQVAFLAPAGTVLGRPEEIRLGDRSIAPER